jgi:hypothetical protein
VRGSEHASGSSHPRYAAWLRTTACVALFAFSACSTATITRRSGPDYRGTIEDSDSESVHVRDGDGTLYRVPRSDIAGIKHPGKMHMLVGAILLGLFTVAAVKYRGRNVEDDYLLGASVAFLAIPGAVLAFYGGATYAGSILSASSSAKPAQPPLPLLPTETQPPVPTSALSSPVQKPASSTGALPPPAPYAPASGTSEPAAAPQPSAPTAPPTAEPAPSAPADRPTSPPP